MSIININKNTNKNKILFKTKIEFSMYKKIKTEIVKKKR